MKNFRIFFQTLSAFSFEEKIFISIKTETQETKQINLPLEITISVFDNEKQLINQQKIESLITQKEEFIRTIFTDYDIISVEVEVTNTDTKESILLTSMVEKN